jgi:hypothetical protein
MFPIIAEPFLDQWQVAGAVVVVIELRAAIGRIVDAERDHGRAPA